MESREVAASRPTDFTVGPWYVRPSMNLISREKWSVQVEPKVMQMLVVLAENPGEVISRDELHERLWPDAVVTDKALTRLASELRKAFDDDAREPSIIATISKSGYRLVAPVTFISPGDGSLQVSDPNVITVIPSTGRWKRKSRFRRFALPAGVFGILAIGVAVGFMLRGGDEDFQPAIRLTTYPGYEISPAMSPDGNEVAFSWQGADGSDWDVYVRQPGSDGLLQLTDNPGDDLHPVWSPDGTEIAFLTYSDGVCSVNRVPALSGAVRRVGSCEWIEEEDRPWRTSGIDWSPDGKQIALSDRGIVVLDVQSGETSRVTQPPAHAIADINPAYSPDGRRIAFMRLGPPASSDLFDASIDGSDVRRLTNEARLILGHDWTVDGEGIVFSSNRSGRFGLWRVGTRGGAITAVPADGWNIEKVSVAPRGRRMAYEGWIYDTNVWRIWLDGNRPKQRVIASTLWDRDAVVSPDGLSAAFVTNRSGQWELWIRRLPNGEEFPLITPSGSLVANPSWSPDGLRLAVQVVSASGSDIQLVGVEGRRVEPFSTDPSDDVVPSWSADGSAIYFGSNRSGSWQIWRQSLQDGTPHRVTSGGGFASKSSPDGSLLFFTRNDSAGLWRISLPDGPEERVFDRPRIVDWGNWDVSAEGLVILNREPT